VEKEELVMNKEQLDKVIDDRLESVLVYEEGSDEAKHAFKEAMKAIELRNEMEKIEDTKKSEKKNTVLKIVEIVAVPVGLFVLDAAFKTYYMKKVCNFEKDYTFTTTPGRGLSGLFQFRKK
jgi:hypothetical protein